MMINAKRGAHGRDYSHEIAEGEAGSSRAAWRAMTESVGRMGMYLVSTSHTHDVPSAVKRGGGH